MKKLAKLLMVLVALAAVPAISAVGIMTLWNSIVTTVCGCLSITFWQSVGLFILGQLLGGGFIILLCMLMGAAHAIAHHHADGAGHWHEMTDEQRREFILRRREYFGFGNRSHNKENDIQ